MFFVLLLSFVYVCTLLQIWFAVGHLNELNLVGGGVDWTDHVQFNAIAGHTSWYSDHLVIMKLLGIILCLVLRLLNSVVADGVYSCPSGCRCTILKRQRDRSTVASSDQSVAPGRKVVCHSSSLAITSVSQIPLDNLPKDTLHLYVVLCFSFVCSSYCAVYCFVWLWTLVAVFLLSDLIVWCGYLGDQRGSQLIKQCCSISLQM